MSIHVISWVLRNSPERLGRRLVLLSLADHADADGKHAFPSVKTMAAEARLSTRQVQRALRDLEEAGAIKPEGTSRYGTTSYTVLMDDPHPPEIDEPSGQDDAATSTTDSATSTTENLPGMSPEPSTEPSKEPSVSPSKSPPKRETARKLWAEHKQLMGGRAKEPGADDLDIIVKSLGVGTEEEIRTAFKKCAASDFHMKRGKHERRRGGRHNSIGKILKPRTQKGETWRSRLDWWLDLEPDEQEQSGRYTRRKKQ